MTHPSCLHPLLHCTMYVLANCMRGCLSWEATLRSHKNLPWQTPSSTLSSQSWRAATSFPDQRYTSCGRNFSPPPPPPPSPALAAGSCLPKFNLLWTFGSIEPHPPYSMLRNFSSTEYSASWSTTNLFLSFSPLPLYVFPPCAALNNELHCAYSWNCSCSVRQSDARTILSIQSIGQTEWSQCALTIVVYNDVTTRLQFGGSFPAAYVNLVKIWQAAQVCTVQAHKTLSAIIKANCQRHDTTHSNTERDRSPLTLPPAGPSRSLHESVWKRGRSVSSSLQSYSFSKVASLEAFNFFPILLCLRWDHSPSTTIWCVVTHLKYNSWGSYTL